MGRSPSNTDRGCERCGKTEVERLMRGDAKDVSRLREKVYKASQRWLVCGICADELDKYHEKQP